MHLSLSPLLLSFAPCALLVLALAPISTARQRLRLASAACIAGFGPLAVAAVLYATEGATSTPLVGTPWIGLASRLDVLSLTMSALISGLGATVLGFSARYLDGDPGQDRFGRWMSVTVASVMWMVAAGHLTQLVVLWAMTGLAVQQLLSFYPTRAGARLASAKKFVLSRAADALLLVALVLLGHQFGTLELQPLLRLVEASEGTLPWTAEVAASFIALAVVLRSAQFPFHGWLTEVMETPTPVSALLHAGVINAGGFVLLRMSALQSHSVGAMTLLVAFGAVTAIVGSLCMRAQTSAKSSLAWSTVAQMGFMTLQCGLGLFSSALVHVVMHSIYKAHAFLSAAGVVEARLARERPSSPSLLLLAGTAAALLVAAGICAVAAGHSPGENVGASLMIAIVLLGVAQPMASVLAAPRRTSAWRALVFIGGLLLSYCAMQWAGARLLQLDGFSPVPAPIHAAVALVVALGFAVVALGYAVEWPAPLQRLWDAAYVHFANGLYVNETTNRWAFAMAQADRAALQTAPSLQKVPS